MLGSKNDFFKQDSKVLKAKRRDVKSLLNIKNFTQIEINYFLYVFDYFCKNPKAYDGETLVKDLNDLPSLSLSGMIHDFEYLELKVWRNLKKKIKSDWKYSQNHEKLGKGWLIPYLRGVGLIISTPFYYLLKIFK